MSRRKDFPKARFIANARAVALGGRIDQIEIDGDPAAVGGDFVIDGGSCALSSAGGRSFSRAAGRDTVFAGQRFVRFEEAEAETWSELSTESGLDIYRTFSRASIRGLEVGGVGDMPLLRLEHGELVVKSTFSKKGTEEDVRFTIETLELKNLSLGGERITVNPIIEAGDKPLPTRTALRNVRFADIAAKFARTSRLPSEAAKPPEKVRLFLAKSQPPKERKCEVVESWVYYSRFGFLRVANFQVTKNSYDASLLEFQLGCAGTGNGGAVQTSGNGTMDPHDE